MILLCFDFMIIMLIWLISNINLKMDKPVRDTDAHHIDETKMAKKIKNFIYHPGDLIGSGFSSNVYKGID